MMDLTALFPQWCGLRIIDAAPEGDRLTLVAYTTAHTASCPLCQQPASSVHSRYQRCVADLLCGGRVLTLVIHARRFFFRTPTCPRQTFRERLPALVATGARRSHGLLARHSFPTRNAARLALFDYIEGFYNTHRRHSALDYLAPIAYERRRTSEGQVA